MFQLVGFLIFFMGLYGFVTRRKHLLSNLLMLELIVLSVFYLLVLVLGQRIMFISLVFLVFSACEGALGLSLIVVIRRLVGGDLFSLWVKV